MRRVRPWDMPPPGLDLDGFLETHETILERMKARLGTYRPPGRPPPLAGLAGKTDDPAIMLLDAWAATADVLSFYQRRLLAEGFVGTAVTDRAVHELAGAVSADVEPPVSASVTVCFTVSDKHDGPVTVARLTGLQSVPGSGGGFQRAPSRTDVTPPLTLPLAAPPAPPGTTAQVFETSADLVARAAWNEMALVRPPEVDSGAVQGDATGILVRGGSYGVKVGDTIFLAVRAEGGIGFAALRRITRIGRARARGCTLFLWSEGAPLSPGAARIDGLQIFTGRAEEPLHGSDAPDWSELTPAQRAQHRAMVGGLQGFDEATSRWRNVEQPAPAGHPDDGRVPVGRVLCLAAEAGGALLAGVAGRGLLRRDGETSPWANVAGIAGRSDVLCLSREAGGRLWAGTSRGVFRSSDAGLTWEPVLGGGMSPESAPSRGYAFYRLPATPVRGLAVLAGDGGAVAIIGTDDGVLRWDPAARIWPTMNEGLPPRAGAAPSAASTAPSGASTAPSGASAAPSAAGVAGVAPSAAGVAPSGVAPTADAAPPGAAIAVRAVAVDAANGLVYAGTSLGLFVRSAENLASQQWKPCDSTSRSFDVSALGVDAKGVVFAGLGARGGLAVRSAGGTWSRAGGSLADVTVSGIVVAGDTPEPAVIVGTDRGVFRSRDGGSTFEILGGMSNPDVSALAVSADGAVIAASPFAGIAGAPDDGWPAWALQKGRIDLARATRRVAPGDLVALVQDADRAGGEPTSLVLEVLGVAATDRADFGRKRRVTTLLVGDADLSAFDRRRARVRFAGTEIPLFDQQVRDLGAVSSADATLDDQLADGIAFAALTRGKTAVVPADPRTLDFPGLIPDLRGRRVVVVGKRLGARVGGALDLKPDDTRLAPVPLVAGELVEAIEMPDDPGARGVWKLRTRLGVEGSADARPGDLTLLPAAADAGDIAQVRKVTACVPVSLPRGLPLPGPLLVTRVTLDEPLSGLFDAATVSVLGNVVEATHGRTVMPDKEVVGISDGSGSLRFTLKNKPLTWTRDGNELVPALEVWVQKRVWTRVASFAGQGPDSQVYVVKTTSDGASVLCFGDGVRGRRPPAESEIVADYRYGAGLAGNVDAGRIVLIRQRALGLRTVVNPLAASGGAEAEPAGDLRERAPLAVRSLDRVVSARDCQDVAVTCPGIARSRATRLLKGRRAALFVTVATGDAASGYQLDPGSTSYRDLVKKLEGVRGVEVGSCAVSYFDVEVALTVAAGTGAAEAQTQARDALLSAFGFEGREIGHEVAVSAVVATLAAVEGVLDARVTRLATTSGSLAEEGVLPARDAAWDDGLRRVVPAELLLINASEGGVRIDVAVAP